jgi:hypothetical protein
MQGLCIAQVLYGGARGSMKLGKKKATSYAGLHDQRRGDERTHGLSFLGCFYALL